MNHTTPSLPQIYASLTTAKRRAVREAYIKQQDGACLYCHTDLQGEPDPIVMDTPIDHRLFPPNFFKHPVHLHHSHDTGLTIGALHSRCNGILWQYYGE